MSAEMEEKKIQAEEASPRTSPPKLATVLTMVELIYSQR